MDKYVDEILLKLDKALEKVKILTKIDEREVK